MSLSTAKRPIFPEVILRFILPLVILACGAGGFFLLTSWQDSFAGTKIAETAIDSKLQTVIVETIQPHDQGIDMEVSGLVVPYREVALAAEVSGRIVYKAENCRAGRYIRKGDELIRIERIDYELGRDEASGMLSEVRSEIANSESLLKIAERQLELERRDFERAQQLRSAVSQADLDQAERELLSAENAVAELENQRSLLGTREKRLEVALRKAQLDLERTNVRAPLSGVIVSDMIEQDAFVQRGSTLLAIEDTEKAEVSCNLRKEELHWLWLAQRNNHNRRGHDAAIDYEVPKASALVSYDLLDNRYSWTGRLDRLEGHGWDSRTRTAPCRVVVDNPREATGRDASARSAAPPALLRGMYVTVAIHVDPATPLWQVTRTAIQPGKVIWIVRNGKLFKQTVRVAQTGGKAAIIHAQAGSLEPNDKVVVSPIGYPRIGLPVNTKTRNQDQASEN